MKKLFFAFYILIGINISAQSGNPPLITDRPDQTESSSTIQAGYLQIETGISYDLFEMGSGAASESLKSLSIGSTLLRLGITEIIELRLGSEFLSQTFEFNNNEISTSGISGLDVGTKIFLFDEKNMMPETALIANLNTPVGNEDLVGENIIPSFILAMSNTLSSNVGLGYNVGVEFAENEQQVYFLSAALGIGLTEKLSCFIESYNFFNSETSPQLLADAGLTYLINNDFQLDASAGTLLNGDATNWFISGGLSYRFKVLK